MMEKDSQSRLSKKKIKKGTPNKVHPENKNSQDLHVTHSYPDYKFRQSAIDC